MKKTSVYDQIVYVEKESKRILEEIDQQTREMYSARDVYSLKYIKIAGCGDSHFAGQALKSAFEKLSGISTEVVEPFEFSHQIEHFETTFYPNQVLIIGISTSGNTPEVVEVLEKFSEKGYSTLAITTNLNSNLVKVAKFSVVVDIKNFGVSPGIASYVYSMLTLAMLAIRFAELKARVLMSEAATYRNNLAQPYNNFEEIMKNLYTKINDHLNLEIIKELEFIGLNNSMATANYSAAKFYEMNGRRTTVFNLSEWRHLSCFIRDYNDLLSVVVLDEKETARRFKEIQPTFDKLGRNYMVFAAEDVEFEGAIHYPSSRFKEFGGLYNFLPTLIIAEIFTHYLNEEYFRSFKAQWEGV